MMITSFRSGGLASAMRLSPVPRPWPSNHAVVAFVNRSVPPSTMRICTAAFSDLSDSNCITDATTRSIIAGAAPDSGSGGGPNSGPGSSGGGGGEGGPGGKDGSGDAQLPPHPMRPWTFLLAALVAVGGTMGFVRKGSTKSLGAGLSGALILALAARSMTGPSMHTGVRVAFAACLLLGVVFLSRFARSKKVFPAGLGAGLSLSYAAAYVATGL